MKKIFILLFILTSFHAFAQQANPELQNLIKESFDYNPTLKQLEQAKVISSVMIDLNRSSLYPNLGVNISDTYLEPVTKIDFPLGPNGSIEHFQLQPNNNFNASLGASYILFDFGKEKAGVDKAKEELQLSDDNIKAVQNQLAAQVSGIYYGLIYLKKAIDVEDSVLDYLAYNKKETEDKLKNGDAIQLDVLNIQALIDNERNRKADLENQRKKQINMLEYATGSIKSPTTSNFDFSTPNSTLDADFKDAMTNNPDFSIIQHKINAANFDVKNAQANQYPQLSLNGALGYKNGYLPDINKLTFNTEAGVALNFPLFSGMRARQQVQLAQENVKLNEIGQTSLMAQYKKDINNALADIYSNNEHLKFSQTQIDESQLAKKITASRYKNGVATYLDVQSSVDGYLRAQLGYLQYQYQLSLANIELARLTAYKYW